MVGRRGGAGAQGAAAGGAPRLGRAWGRRLKEAAEEEEEDVGGAGWGQQRRRTPLGRPLLRSGAGWQDNLSAHRAKKKKKS